MPGITETPVDKQTALGLATYLILATIVAGYVFVSLWSAQPQLVIGPAPAPPCAGVVGPRLTNLYPNQVNVGAVTDVIAIGCNFPAASAVKVNGVDRKPNFLDAGHIRIPLAAADVTSAGTVVLTLSAGNADYGIGTVSVVQPGVNPCAGASCTIPWSFLGIGLWTLSPDVQLLLLILAAGSLGSSIYALKSMADFRGVNRLFKSWVTFYLIQPFEGAGIALLIYLVVRGGFLAGASDSKTVNQFGMCAIAALAGAFSDTALLKLNEVFNTLFKPQDDRGGKLGNPKITTTTLPDGQVGVTYKQTLESTAGTPPLNWSVSPALPPGLSLDRATGTLSGTPTAPSPKTTYTFTVTDSATSPASGTADISLEIKPDAGGLKITTTSLPDVHPGTPYSQTLAATGGTAPLKWSVTPALPAALALDATSGAISGTLAAASPKATYKFAVTDGKSTATQDLTL